MADTFLINPAGRVRTIAWRMVAIGAAVVALAACSGSKADDTLALLPTEEQVADSAAAATDTGAGPIAQAESNAEAALAAQREGAASNLKEVSITFESPADVAGTAKVSTDGAECTGPGNAVDGGTFALVYTDGKDAKVAAFSAKTQGSYEGPGSYAAEFAWTAPSGPVTGTGSVFVYEDEMSGEFEVTGDTVLTGSWECEFKK